MSGNLRRSDIIRLALLWWAGVNLRITLLAVPPVIPLIHEDLALDPVLVGALNALPILLFAALAVGGSRLIARIGARRALVVGLLTVGTASALRGLGPSVEILFGMTFVMGLGIAMMQPAMPAMVRVWCPASVGLATATYANGLLVGEILSASLTIPLVMPVVGGRWPAAFLLWSVPALLTAVAILGLTRNDEGEEENPSARWWPDWRSARTWRIGLILGGAGSLYFTANAFVPDLLSARGEAAYIGAALTSLNGAQIPASVLLMLFSSRLMMRRGPLAAVALIGACGLVGLLSSAGTWAVVWAGVIGFASAFILIWTLALPPMIAARDEVHRMSAAVFTIGYLCAFASPFIGGAAWKLSGTPSAGLVPAGAFLAVLLVAVAGLELPRDRPGA